MRIKKLITNSVPSSPCSSSTSSSSISTTHSLASSTDSSSPSSSSSSTSSQLSRTSLITRCRGLDLLVKAIHQVTAGSVVGVPYIQKRVIRRRRRRRRISALSFANYNNVLILTELSKKEEDQDEKIERVEENEAANALLKRQRRVMALPSKYQNSVLPSWKPKTRHGRDLSRLVMK